MTSACSSPTFCIEARSANKASAQGLKSERSHFAQQVFIHAATDLPLRRQACSPLQNGLIKQRLSCFERKSHAADINFLQIIVYECKRQVQTHRRLASLKIVRKRGTALCKQIGQRAGFGSHLRCHYLLKVLNDAAHECESCGVAGGLKNPTEQTEFM